MGFRSYRKKKHTKCSCYSLIMFFLLNQVLIYNVENQPNRHVIIGILLDILHQEKLGERIAQHCNTWCHLITRLFFIYLITRVIIIAISISIIRMVIFFNPGTLPERIDSCWRGVQWWPQPSLDYVMWHNEMQWLQLPT